VKLILTRYLGSLRRAHLWVLGLHTANAEFLGRGVLGDSYWDFWLKLVRDWEAKELKD
jgi:hypothetical protein